MAFIEIQFPTKLALMATGGPGYKTNINPAFSGYEQRNINWSQSRGSWDVAFEHKPQNEYSELLAMFHAAKGMANSFRLKDPTDYIGTGEYIGTGDGSTRTFQLQRTYTFPISQYQVIRPIQKPITSSVKDFAGNSLTDTVKIYLDGALQTSNWSVDYTTGVVTFASGHAPGNGVIITADYQFHYPVRFNLDDLKVQVETPIASGLVLTVSGISLIEVRIKVGQSS